MKKILLLTTVVAALALPSAASASEPAEWYVDNVPAEYIGGVEAEITGGYIEVEQPALYWDFRCEDMKGHIGWGNAFISETANCDAQGSMAVSCHDFPATLSSKGLPLVPSKEGSVTKVDSAATYAANFKFGKGGCAGHVAEAVPGPGNGLHGTWENISGGIGKITFVNNYLGNGAVMNGVLYVKGYEGGYLTEVGEEEYEYVFGTPVISIK